MWKRNRVYKQGLTRHASLNVKIIPKYQREIPEISKTTWWQTINLEYIGELIAWLFYPTTKIALLYIWHVRDFWLMWTICNVNRFKSRFKSVWQMTNTNSSTTWLCWSFFLTDNTAMQKHTKVFTEADEKTTPSLTCIIRKLLVCTWVCVYFFSTNCNLFGR